MKIAFLYGGQGSQVEGMGSDLYEKYQGVRDFYDSIDIDIPVKEISFKGDKDLVNKTEYTQPLMIAFQIAVTKILEEKGIHPSITAGLSLGEFASLYAGGVLEEDELLKLVRYRGVQMEKLAEKIDSAMLAVLTDDLEYLEELSRKVSDEENFVEVTNINTRSQLVISGEKSRIEEAKTHLDEDRVRYIELNTGGPFHTSYMRPVAEDLAHYMEDLDMKEADIDIIHNLYGEIVNDIDIKEALAQQVASRVLFKQSLENILKEKPDLIVEIGYGDVIKGFMRRLDRKTKVYTVNSVETIEKLLEEVERLNG